MRLLIIGGTRFLGRHLVTAALANGHNITLFNRGRSDPAAFPEVEHLQGDRTDNLSALEGRRWDAVIDTCGYVPRIVAASAQLLAEAVDHYTFISTVSVYAEPLAPGSDEDAPLGQLAEPTEEVTGESYGPLKVLCEQAVMEAMPDKTLIIRPGLIVGPYDYSDRFPYWPRRVAQGGEVLAPGRPERIINAIDGRDLAEWTLHVVEQQATGIYNATGPDDATTMQQLLDTCKTVSASDASFTWVSEEFLLEQGVGPWMELPMWIPDADNAIFRVKNDKAKANGLTFRRLAETVADTLAWDQSRPADLARAAGLAVEREVELLRIWRQRG